VFGSLAVVAMAFLGRDLFGDVVGVLTGVLAAVWPVLVVYSQEYRPYSLEVLLATLAMLLLVKSYRSDAALAWALLAMTVICTSTIT